MCLAALHEHLLRFADAKNNHNARTPSSPSVLVVCCLLPFLSCAVQKDQPFMRDSEGKKRSSPPPRCPHLSCGRFLLAPVRPLACR